MDTEVVRILMEAGYIAGGYGLAKEARTIFQGVQAARPDSKYPAIGIAFTFMCMGKPNDAIEVLEDHVLKETPDHCLARSFLSLALKLDGQLTRARAVADEVIADCRADAAAHNMAKALMDEL